MILTPSTMMPMTALNFLSKDGKCFTFDHRANGYGRGEGIGVVVMKRLNDAIRDNDPIRAVIRASRLNQDGRSQGLLPNPISRPSAQYFSHGLGITHPSMDAQISNIQAIYAESGLDVNQTAYVECHGTGTQAGDVTELCAIGQSVAAQRTADNPVIVGSIKPNIGHTEGSAGVAGLIKSVLVLEKGVIPPNINFEKGNPAINFEQCKVKVGRSGLVFVFPSRPHHYWVRSNLTYSLKVPTQPMEWPLDGLRRISVNSFGFGGTNAHVILDQAPEIPHSTNDALPTSTTHGVLVTFSAHSQSVLKSMIRNHADYLRSKLSSSQYKSSPQDKSTFLLNYAFTQNCRRSKLEWRMSVVSSTVEDLISTLESIDSSMMAQSTAKKRPRVAFAFCGQGAQFAHMGLDLCAYTTFRHSLMDAEQCLKRLGCPFSLMEELRKSASESDIDLPLVSQPATTAVQVAIVDLLLSWGVEPHCVVGHSSGEIAAAYAAGLISRQAAWSVAYYRGLAATRLLLKCPDLDGGMLAVKLPHDETQKLLEKTDSEAVVACINSPKWTTVSGTVQALGELSIHLSQRSVHHIRLPVHLPYHSSHMRAASDDYRGMLQQCQLSPLMPSRKKGVVNQLMTPFLSLIEGVPTYPDGERMAAAEKCTGRAIMYSSVTGRRIDDIMSLDSRYWALNMTSPVRFVDAVQAMRMGSKPDLVIEVSPRTTLKGLIRDTLGDHGAKLPYASVWASGVTQTKTLLEVAGKAWSMGVSASMLNILDA